MNFTKQCREMLDFTTVEQMSRLKELPSWNPNEMRIAQAHSGDTSVKCIL